ncbi:MAG: molybdate ABC transporter substrate-binding protein [Oleispira sp.]|nr:molybdate ABC transporter substrate-binding protein [Oleispira sp.]
MRLAYFSLFLLLNVLTSAADTCNIAVASNFTAVMKTLITEFQRSSPHKIKASYASSGKFYAQIHHGAPYHVFFSADQNLPHTLENDGLAATGTRFTYAFGALALWSSNAEFNGHELDRLKTDKFNKLSLANPKIAPYGQAAIEVLTSLHLRQKTEHKWVRGENIAQAYQFVATGNADLGFIALSQVLSRSKMDNQSHFSGHFWRVPSHLHQPIRQDAILLNRGLNNPAALAFLDFIHSDKARRIIESYGYKTEMKITEIKNTSALQ